MTLRPHELKLASVLLALASDILSNRSCNDFDLVWEGGLTQEEAYQVNQDFVQFNGDADEWEDEQLRVSHAVAGDSGLAGWLAARMKEESERNG
jgi:hypothetical protein